jgi:hypothetical protein
MGARRYVEISRVFYPGSNDSGSNYGKPWFRNLSLAIKRIQMMGHLNYTVLASNSVIPAYDAAGCANASCYIETSYSDHNDSALLTNCQNNDCTNQQYAQWALYQWKQGLANMNLPVSNISAIVCADSAMGVPTTNSPNCSSGSLVVKIVWVAHNRNIESAILGNNNYVMLKVPQR